MLLRTKTISSLVLHVVALILSYATLISPSHAQSREEKVLADRKRVVDEGFWIYNDLDQAFQLAEQNGKPILVSVSSELGAILVPT